MVGADTLKYEDVFVHPAGGAAQLAQTTVDVWHDASVPQAALVLICIYNEPLAVHVTVTGDVPEPRTVPPGVP